MSGPNATSNPYISPKVQGSLSGDGLAVRSGGEITLETGAKLWSQGNDISNAVPGVAAGYRLARGQITTVTAADTVVIGLSTVVSVVVSMDSDPTDNPEWVTGTIGDQGGSPAAGSVIIKTWQNTGGTDPTPTAATTFGKKVNYIAIGT
jgi:hypothetical protein